MASHSQPPAQELTRATADAAAGAVPAAAGEEQELVPSPSAGPGAASQPERPWIPPPAPPSAAVDDAAQGSIPPVEQISPTTSISNPKAVENSKLKRKTIAIDLNTLWSRDGKKSRACADALVNRSPIAEHVQVEQQVQVQNTSPSNQLHSTKSSPSVQNQQHIQIAGAMNTSPIAEPEIEHEASEESENIDEENDTEDADYDVNDQNRIRRGCIAKGACRPETYDFPQHPAGALVPPSVRKSTRIKSRPLQDWLGERMLYGRIQDDMCTVIGIKSYSPGEDGTVELRVKSLVDERYSDVVARAGKY